MCCSNGKLVLRSRIQHVVHDHGLKEQDFTETFLRRAHGFSITDDNENKWFKATAWRFTNLAHVVEQREKANVKKRKKAVVAAAPDAAAPAAADAAAEAPTPKKKKAKAKKTE